MAEATNPATLRVDVLRWLMHKPTWPLIWAGSAVAFFVAAVWWHWLFWLPTALMILANIQYWRLITNHFWRGDVNPGVIVSVQPLLVATTTDLTKGVGNYPALKIVPVRLSEIDGQRPQVGSRLAMVCMYDISPDDVPHWSDFLPFPAQYATRDSAQLARLMNTFTNHDWNRLTEYLKRIPKPYQPGLYMIERESKPPEPRGT